MNGSSSLISLGIILLILLWRIYRKPKPVSNGGVSILYPLFIYLVLIIFAGSKLFVNPRGVMILPHVPFGEILVALLLGGIFAIPVLLSTNYEVRQNLVYVKKNKTYILVILGVIILRVILRGILSTLMPVLDQLFLTLMMATVYLVIWRVGSFMKFRKLVRETGMGMN